VFGGLDLGDSASYVVGGGIMENSKHFVFSGDVSRDNDGKSNDGVNTTRRGHNDRFKGSSYFRFSNGLFIGGGARWAKQYTPAYTKEQWHPTVGAGADLLSPFFSTRIQADYVLPQGAEHTSRSGCTVPKGQCGSGVQGPEFSIFFPSPRVKGHFFARITIGVFGAHTTVTSTDPVLTAQQKSQTVFASEAQFTFLYRF
jgi:hypothetical protein